MSNCVRSGEYKRAESTGAVATGAATLEGDAVGVALVAVEGAAEAAADELLDGVDGGLLASAEGRCLNLLGGIAERNRDRAGLRLGRGGGRGGEGEGDESGDLGVEHFDCWLV